MYLQPWKHLVEAACPITIGTYFPPAALTRQSSKEAGSLTLIPYFLWSIPLHKSSIQASIVSSRTSPATPLTISCMIPLQNFRDGIISQIAANKGGRNIHDKIFTKSGSDTLRNTITRLLCSSVLLVRSFTVDESFSVLYAIACP